MFKLTNSLSLMPVTSPRTIGPCVGNSLDQSGGQFDSLKCELVRPQHAFPPPSISHDLIPREAVAFMGVDI